MSETLLTSAIVAGAFLLFWCCLAAGLVWVFYRMMLTERDTRHGEEEGKEPLLEVIGGGAINRSGWGPAPLFRLALYEDFLAASMKSRRVTLPYSNITGISRQRLARKDQLRITGRQRGAARETLIRFNSPDIAPVAEILEQKTDGQNAA